jgi:hypothetical protein
VSLGVATLLSLAVASFDAQWADSLAPNAAVELPAGTYLGPWKLAAGVRLTAGPGAVLRAGPGADATLTLTGDARIEGLGVEVAPGGYGIRVGSGRAELIGIHLTAAGPAKAAIYVAHGEVVVSGGSIDGPSDYGVLAERALGVTLSGTEVRAVRAGTGIVSGPAVIEGCSFRGPFSEAGISLIDVPRARLARNVLTAVKSLGIKLTGSIATLSGNQVTGGRADSQGLEGNSLYAFNSQLTLAADKLGDAQGATSGPVVLLLHSSARFDGVLIQGGLESLIYAASGSSLKAADSELRGAPVGLTVEDGSSVNEAGFRFEGVKRHLMHLAP